MRHLPGVLFSQGGSRPAAASAIAAIALAVIAIAANRSMFGGTDAFPADMHAAASLDLAVNRARCGTTGLISEVFVPSRFVREHPDAIDRPLADAVDAAVTAPGGYCRTVVVPYAHNENSLMLLEATVLRLVPRVSPRGIALALASVSAVAVVVAAYACLRIGVSWWLSAILVVLVAAIAGRSSIYQFTVYPLVATMAVLFTAAIALAANTLRGRSAAAHALAGAGLGLLAGLAMNIRTSHAIVYVALVVELVAVLSVVRAREQGRRAAIVSAAALSLACAAGAAAFDVAFVRPIRAAAARANNNYVFHTIAHPLVMGLAAPPSDFSRREGLEWNDSIGLQVARRIDPNATFLGPTYEGALYTYYFRLWREHPAEMRALYWRKLLAAGRGVFLQASELAPRVVRRVYLVFADRANGLELIVGSLGVALAAFWRASRAASPRAVGVLAIATVTVMILAEAAIIFPTFFLAYHAWLLLVVAAAPAIALQIALDAAAGRWI
jgi:hypothetical protein